MQTAKVVAHSISDAGIQIITLQLRYWRGIHAEFMTHRVFSRNASSSRAIPVEIMLKQCWNSPAGPLHWGANQPGMQAAGQLAGWRLKAGKLLWRTAAKTACCIAWAMMKIGLHKQVANRILEPFQYISVIVTATDWDNFFQLRCHPDAQPEIQDLAGKMREAIEASTPESLAWDQWHLPYVTRAEERDMGTRLAIKCSVARCARVSYLTHDGKKPSAKKDIELHDKLVVSVPIHASPAEHQARPVLPANSFTGAERHRNFLGWVSYRVELESPF